MSMEYYEKVDEIDGKKSFYVTAKIGWPVMAEDMHEAEDIFSSTVAKLNIALGDEYTIFEVTSVGQGPQLWQRKADAPPVCPECKGDVLDPAQHTPEAHDEAIKLFLKLLDEAE